MRRFWKNQQGISLFELLLTIIIVGIALPSLISIVGLVTRNFLQNEIMMKCVGFADSRMEEIIAFKEDNWDWYKTIYDYDTMETPETDYEVTTSISQITNWGSEGIDAYEVNVTATHSSLEDGYELTLRLTKYH